MSFRDWLFSEYPNSSISGQWGLLHILTLIISISAIVLLTLIFKDKKLETRQKVAKILMKIILILEITRRVVNLCKNPDPTTNDLLYTLLPRPWCSIACWSIIFAVVFNKQFLYNFASIIALICSLIFFAYPEAGFNSEVILFENFYSISTHSLLLICSVLFVTLGLTKFEYKKIWKELICFAVMFAYGFLEIFVLDIATDPLYFMPGGDIQSIFGISYPLYLTIYICFIVIFVNSFYLISDREKVKMAFKKNKNNIK